MKKVIIIASTVMALALSAGAVFAICQGGRDDFLNQNVEALMESEIVVGPLCMECKNCACTTLGEVLLEHYPA
jgi:hypothetical protein